MRRVIFFTDRSVLRNQTFLRKVQLPGGHLNQDFSSFGPGGPERRAKVLDASGAIGTAIPGTKHCVAKHHADCLEPDLEFFGAHPYRTRFAQLRYGGGRAANLAQLQKRLRRERRQLERARADESGAAKRLGRSAETIFYHFTRIHIGLVGLADRRTSTMIHVNAIMMSIVVALLARRIQTEKDLLLPTVLLLCVNVTVVFLAIYSMRAGRRGLFGRSSLSAAEAREHDANLLALTNETTLSLSEYAEQMSGLLADPVQFQRRVIEDLYFGRRVLVERGKTLRLTYGIFIYGVTLAIVVFVVTVMRR